MKFLFVTEKGSAKVIYIYIQADCMHTELQSSSMFFQYQILRQVVSLSEFFFFSVQTVYVLDFASVARKLYRRNLLVKSLQRAPINSTVDIRPTLCNIMCSRLALVIFQSLEKSQ